MANKIGHVIQQSKRVANSQQIVKMSMQCRLIKMAYDEG
jgi:hypothetical protein